MEYNLNIIYYIDIYKKWWKSVIKLMLLAMFFTVIFSLITPVSYVSRITLISIDSTGSTAATIGKFLGFSNVSLGASSNDIITAILKSKRMERDINNFMEINKRVNFRYAISTSSMSAGLIIDIKGNDPAFTEKIANFAVQNLDKINGELNITPNKPMVKVLDPAVYGLPVSRKILQKMFMAAFSVFLICSFYIFAVDYFKKKSLP